MSVLPPLVVDALAARKLKPVTFKVFATAFGGPHDPGTGHIGYHGDDLNRRWRSFAELSTNLNNDEKANDYNALGALLGLKRGLPYGTLVRVRYHGKHILLRKRDIGFGGPGPDGRRLSRADNPRIDLWWRAAKYLGHNGFDWVEIDILR